MKAVLINICKESTGKQREGCRFFWGIGGKRYARESFIAAKVESSIVAPFCYTGTCNTLLFNFWSRPGQVVIMDNASFHKSQDFQQLIKEAGCNVLFLPPYSPDTRFQLLKDLLCKI